MSLSSFELYTGLKHARSSVRIDSISVLLSSFQIQYSDSVSHETMEKEIKFVLKRLIRGMGSSNESARAGFAAALVTVLEEVSAVSTEMILELEKGLIEKFEFHSAQDRRDFLALRTCVALVLMRAGRWREMEMEKAGDIIRTLGELVHGKDVQLAMKNFVFEAIAALIIDAKTKNLDRLTNGVKIHFEEIIAQNTPESIFLFYSLTFCYQRKKKVFPLKNHPLMKLLDSSEFGQLREPLSRAACVHPLIHSVWPLILDYLLAQSEQLFFSFWKSVVDYLFSLSVKHQYLGLRLLLKYLKRVLAGSIVNFFTEASLTTLSNSVKDKEKQLYECASQLMSQIVELCEEEGNRKDALAIALVVHFSSVRISSGKIASLIKFLLPIFNLDDIKGYVHKLKELFEQGTDREKQLWSVNQLVFLWKSSSIAKDYSISLDILTFLFQYAFFVNKDAPQKSKSKKNKTTKLLAVTDEAVRSACSTQFFSVLAELEKAPVSKASEVSHEDEKLVKKVEKQELCWALLIHHHATVLLEQYNPVFKFTENQLEARQVMLESVSALQKLIELSKDVKQTKQYFAFLLLFCHIGLLQFSLLDVADSTVSLMDLQKCFENAFMNKKKEEDAPEFINVLVDILVSLLAKNSSFLRDISSIVFSAFMESLRKETLSILMDVVVDKQDEDDSDDEEEEEDLDEDLIDQESDLLNEDSENDRDNSDIEVDADEGALEVLEEVLNESEVKDLKEEDSENDEETIELFNNNLTLEQLEEHDGALIHMLQLRKNQHKNRRELKEQKNNFKLRVLQLVKDFIRKQQTNPLLLYLFVPICQALRKNIKTSDGPLFASLENAMNKLSEVRNLKSLNLDDAKKVLQELVVLGQENKSKKIYKFIANGTLALIRVIFAPQNELDEKEREFVFACVKNDFLVPFQTKSFGAFNSKFLIDLLGRYPAYLGFPLLHLILNAIPTLKSFVAFESFLLVQKIVSLYKNCPEAGAILASGSNAMLNACIFILKDAKENKKALAKVRDSLGVCGEYFRILIQLKPSVDHLNAEDLGKLEIALEELTGIASLKQAAIKVSGIIASFKDLMEDGKGKAVQSVDVKKGKKRIANGDARTDGEKKKKGK